jgi:hypothetical protein
MAARGLTIGARGPTARCSVRGFGGRRKADAHGNATAIFQTGDGVPKIENDSFSRTKQDGGCGSTLFRATLSA